MTKLKKEIVKKRLRPEARDIGAKNYYDPFNLPFLIKKDGKIFNGEFDVTDAPRRLRGVVDGNEEIKLTDYLVYRPLPKELIAWRNVPNYHPDSLDMENWYAPLIEFCYDGVWVDGEYFNPLFVYWLNVFVFPVPKYTEDGEPTEEFDYGHPAYSNIDRYFFDYCWKAELNRKDVAIMGGRGVGKSFLINSILDREYRLFPKSLSIVSSTNEDTTNEAWNKIEQCLNAIESKHRVLKLKRLPGGDSAEKKQAGEKYELPDGTDDIRGHLSSLEKIIYGKNPGKTRGKRPNRQLIEEFAAFPPSYQKGSLKACKRESRGSWYVMGSIKKCTVYYAGTGGTVENDEAKEIFCHCSAHEILETFDFENGGKGHGFFIPTHIKRAGTWEKTGCPDVELAKSQVNIERDAAKGDTVSYIGLLQEYPMNLKEVFMRKGVNIFNQDKIASQRIEIQHGSNPVIPEKGFLNWKRAESGKIIGVEWDPSPFGDIEILEHPHWLSPEALPDEKEPIKNLYVAGADSIDQGLSDSSFATDNRKGSELAILVKKRVLEKGYFRTSSNVYVAKYKKRSQNVRDDWDNAMKLSYYFNAEVNIEYTKIGIVSHFREHGFYHMLKKRPSINLAGADPTKSSNLIGTTASTPIIDHQDQKVADYIDHYYNDIWFSDLLEQLQDYNRDDRTKFDLVIAMGLCELSDEDLLGKGAKPPAKLTEGFKLFGYYTDPVTGYKKYGVLPEQGGYKEELKKTLDSEAQKFMAHGGVRWIDATDPKNPKFEY
jgi:hypothetical protein